MPCKLLAGHLIFLLLLLLPSTFFVYCLSAPGVSYWSLLSYIAIIPRKLKCCLQLYDHTKYKMYTKRFTTQIGSSFFLGRARGLTGGGCCVKRIVWSVQLNLTLNVCMCVRCVMCSIVQSTEYIHQLLMLARRIQCRVYVSTFNSTKLLYGCRCRGMLLGGHRTRDW